MFGNVISWFSNSYTVIDNSRSTNVVRTIPFWLIHVACLGVFIVEYSHIAIVCCLISYFIRMFAITGFYHRYFSHKSFKTSRITQFVFALLGASAAQRGPLWWSAHHRKHHRYSDSEQDEHSPVVHSFWWSHILWFVSNKNFPTHYRYVSDLSKFKELLFINNVDLLIPILYAVFWYSLGTVLEYKGINTNGLQLLVYGFFVSTVILYHATFSVNSIAHKFGKRKFKTKDNSRNNLLVAILTLGEGWHNNHHFWPQSVRQGFLWYEVDVTYYVLRFFEKIGLIWDLKHPPEKLLNAR